MVDNLNRETYKTIDGIFNNNLSVYKDIISEIGGTEFQNKLINKMSGVTSDSGAARHGKIIVQKWRKCLMTLQQNKVTHHKRLVWLQTLFEKNYLKILEDTPTKSQLMKFDPDKKWAAYRYDIKGTAYTFYLIFNFSGNDIGPATEDPVWNGTEFVTDVIHTDSGVILAVPPMQIKLFVVNSGYIEYTWPPDDSDEEHLKNFNFDDVGPELHEYWQEAPNASKSLTGVLGWADAINLIFGGEDAYVTNLFKSLYPIASSHIFETVWKNASQQDLFLASNFNSIPLTNQEVDSKCIAGENTYLLDTRKVRSDVDEMRRALECVISAFEKFDAIQVANIYGLYKLMIKVCIIEEYFKIIFLFAFVKISDVIESGAYMNVVIDNVKQLTESGVGNGYARLLDYSSKVINGRQQLGDFDDEEDMPQITSGEDCLKQIIKETAVEIDSILDKRVQNFISPNWQESFGNLEDLDPNEPESYFKKSIF